MRSSAGDAFCDSEAKDVGADEPAPPCSWWAFWLSRALIAGRQEPLASSGRTGVRGQGLTGLGSGLTGLGSRLGHGQIGKTRPKRIRLLIKRIRLFAKWIRVWLRGLDS